MSSASWTTAQGAAKKTYSDLQQLQPAIAIITKRAPIDASVKDAGLGYQVPVLVRPPNGVTYIGSSPTKTTLLAGQPMNIQQATAIGYETDVHEETPWSIFSRIEKQGPAAVDSYMMLMGAAMKRVGSTRHECSVLLGQQSLGTVGTATDLGSSNGTIQFTAATWRGGLWWALGPGATFDSFTTTTKNNASGALVLVGVTTAARTIQFTYTGTFASEVAAGDTIWLEGTWTGSAYADMPGLITQYTASTNLGIDTTVYNNFASNTASVGGAITPDVLEQYFGVLRNRMQEGKLTMYCPETVWQQVLEQVQALRYIDQSYSPNDQKVGSKEVTISTHRFGDVEIVLHPMLADTEAVIQVDQAVIRVGSRDVTFGIPSRIAPNATELLHIAGTNAAEAFVSVDAAVINKMPSTAMYLSGITVS